MIRILLASLLISFSSTAIAETIFKKAPQTRDAVFVANLYSDLLGREAGSAELAAFLGLLQQGVTRAAGAAGILSSVEFRSSAVGKLFDSLLGRSVSQAELTGCLAKLASGASIEDIRAGILSSQEYYERKGGEPSEPAGFITGIYQDLLGRTPTDSEQTAAQVLFRGNKGQDDLVDLILGSQEYNSKVIRDQYVTYLGRTPSSIETARLLQLLASVKLEDLILIVLGSEEYFVLNAPGFVRGKDAAVFLGHFVFDSVPDFSTVSLKIRWGDGRTTTGDLLPAVQNEYAVYGVHKFNSSGKFNVSIVLTLGKQTIRKRVLLVTKKPLSSFSPFGGFKGGVRVAVGDVNGDGVQDILTGLGPSAAPHVKVFNGNDGALLHSFFAYEADFKGGLYIAAGDLNGDGYAEVITGAGAGGSPHVKAFSGADGSLLQSFFAYDGGFTGGVQVAAGDVNGDGLADIITGAGPGSGPHVKVFDGSNLNELHSFFAYDANFTGGVFVASADLNGDGKADVITGAGPGAGPHVKSFSGADGSLLGSFFAYPTGFQGGVRVAAGDVNGDGLADIITGAGAGGGPHVKAFDGRTSAQLQSFFAYPQSFKGGVYVAAGDLNGDGKLEFVSGAGQGPASSVKIKEALKK